MSRKIKKKTLFILSMIGLPLLGLVQHFSKNTSEGSLLTEDQLRTLISSHSAQADYGGGGPGPTPTGDGGMPFGDCPSSSGDCPGDPNGPGPMDSEDLYSSSRDSFV